MALSRLFVPRSSRTIFSTASQWYSGDAGSIREAGGAFSKKEKAQEDQYFRRLEQEQMEKLKKLAQEHHEEEISHHQDSIKELQEQIDRHKEKVQRHKKKLEDTD